MLTSREAMGLMGVGQTVQGAPAFTTTGGATCPSEEQLQGIVDPNDPCQGGGTGPSTVIPNVQTTAAAPAVATVQQILADIQAGLSPTPTASPAAATTAPAGTLLGIPNNVWLIGGAALVALLLISSGGRRR